MLAQEQRLRLLGTLLQCFDSTSPLRHVFQRYTANDYEVVRFSRGCDHAAFCAPMTNAPLLRLSRVIAKSSRRNKRELSLHGLSTHKWIVSHISVSFFSTMKLSLVVPILVLLASFGPVGAWQLRRVESPDNRKLAPQGFDFIVSEASVQNNLLCVTAVEGTASYGSVELRSCDFDSTPSNQLWSRQGNKFVSAIGSGNRCMTVNHGSNLFDGVRIRLGNCNDGLTTYTWNDGHADQLKVVDNTLYCLTSTGSTASSGDRIHAKPCLDRLDYKWTFTAPPTMEEENPFGTLYELYVAEANACVQPKNHDDILAPIILDTCDVGRAWYVKDQIGGRVMFRSAIDPTLCLQAGFCHAKDGTWLRLIECDEENSLQDFSWQDYEAPIKLADNTFLCMVYQGSSAEVGDIMIMKNCATRSYEWSGNAV